MRITTAFALVGFLISAAPALAATARPIAKFQDWSAYVHEADGSKLCFVASEPKDMEPKNVIRGQVLFYISTWASTGVRNEVSVKIGYPLKPSSAPQVVVGNTVIDMFVNNDKAFIASSDMEKKLVDAMKAGNTMVVKGVSQRGTATTDKYSLSGITAALQRMAKDCP